MKQAIEISDTDIEEIVAFLNTLLANEYALYTKTRNMHWNINGLNFHKLYKFIKNQYKTLDILIDDIAERIRSLGHFALGSLKDFLNVTHMEKENHDFSNTKQIIQTLVNDHETIIRMIRNDITNISDKYKDSGTADFLTGLMKQHEKMVCRLKAFLS